MTKQDELRALADEQDGERMKLLETWQTPDLPRHWPMYSPCIGDGCKVMVWGKFTHCSRCLRVEAERIEGEHHDR